MTPLGDLPGGTANGGAYAISANGEVVVGYSSSTNGNEPFRWTSSGGMVGLGDLPGGGFGGAAQAVSADGSVIVGQGMADGGNRAFAWDATHGMQSLTDLLLAAGVNLTGWTLTAATGVSADGTVIVGDGTHNGNMEGWIATLPNPTLVLKGKRKLTTNRTRVTVRGTATEARRVEFKVRGKPFKTAKGSPGKWRIPLRLRNGRNTIQIRADGLLRMTPPIKASIRLRG